MNGRSLPRAIVPTIVPVTGQDRLFRINARRAQLYAHEPASTYLVGRASRHAKRAQICRATWPSADADLETRSRVGSVPPGGSAQVTSDSTYLVAWS